MRLRPDKQAETAGKDRSQSQQDAPDPDISSHNGGNHEANGASGSLSEQSRARTSWYSGSWRSKASPLTATAHESVSVEQGVTLEAPEQREEKNTEAGKQSGKTLAKNMRRSRKSEPLTAEATRVHVTSDASSKSRPQLDAEEKQDAMEDVIEAEADGEDDKDKTRKATGETSTLSNLVRPHASAWLGGWWSRPDGYNSDSEKRRESTKRRKLDDSSSAPMPSTPPHEMAQSPLHEAQTLSTVRKVSDAPSEAKDNESRSWFGTWTSTQNQRQKADKPGSEDVSRLTGEGPPPAEEHMPSAMTEDERPSAITADGASKPKPSGWAFWSYDRPKDVATTPNGTQKQLGEIAVADTPSQSHPEVAQFNEQRFKGKPEKRKNITVSAGSEKIEQTAEKTLPATEAVAPGDNTASVTSRAIESLSQQRGKAKVARNVVSPMFEGMYPPATSSGYVERLARYFAQTLYLPGSSNPTSRHVLHKVDGLPKIKKAIAIGIHGFFPAPLLQRVLGPPTGTSIRFTNYAAAAITEWCKEHQPEVKTVEIEKVALEGEGLIAGRVDTLWKLLLNWTSHLRQADFILVACHSQGVPVAITLVAKLIQLGVLMPHARIGICAMAGINLGPFLEYRSRLFAGSALELFNFCDSNSDVSKAYFAAVDTCLRHGVRISYVGSLDDQLVSLESSLFAPLTHPYIHRATFIDGRLHTPSFLTHLVIFALKLRNLGLSDHGLLRELSAPLAGSLVSGEGHSRIYDDPAVYRLATDFALESTDVDPASFVSADNDKVKDAAFKRRSSVSSFPSNTAQANSMRCGSMSAVRNLPGVGASIAAYEPLVSGANSNPFYLPWAVRGMLEEEVVKRDMKEEVAELVKQFDDWRPQSKVLKDVKWRLEGVRSML